MNIVINLMPLSEECILRHGRLRRYSVRSLSKNHNTEVAIQ